MAEPLAVATNKTKIDIDSHGGDVFLVLEGAELHVCSYVMSCAYKVWRAMFGPHFVEGRTIRCGQPLYLPLPEDDTQAMTVMCNIIHHKYQFDVPSSEPEFFEKLAAISEKYDCSQALSQWTALRLGPLLCALETGFNFGPLLLPAIHFDDPAMFHKITKLMVYAPCEPYVVPSSRQNPFGISTASQDLLPEGFLFTISEKEHELKKSLVLDLELLVKRVLDKKFNTYTQVPVRGPTALSQNSHDRCDVCECDCTRLFYFLKQLSQHGLFPATLALETKSLAALLSALKACDFSVPNQLHNGRHKECPECQPKFSTEAACILNKITNSFDGLCLDCVKNGPLGASKDGKIKKCRIAHEGFLGFKKEA
ncbi:hypothetical protein MMC18_009491 [Xylographa bjoerkii]|nr:hypothetical protein [Xylographa bjoerkii]